LSISAGIPGFPVSKRRCVPEGEADTAAATIELSWFFLARLRALWIVTIRLRHTAQSARGHALHARILCIV